MAHHSPGRLRWAARIAAATASSIDALIAWDYPATYGWDYPADSWCTATTEGWQPDVHASEVLQDTLDDVFDGHRPSNLEASARQGQPRSVLLEASKGAKMLVVGSRGHGGFTGLLLGSVSAACAEHARCAVLVVHGDDPIDTA